MRLKPGLRVVTSFGNGSVLGKKLEVLSAVTSEQTDGNDSAQFVVRTPFAQNVIVRTPLRFTGTDGVTREYRVRRVARDPLGSNALLECAGVVAELATAGLIRAVQNGALTTTFGGSLTIAQWVTNYVLTNLSDDGLSWLNTVLGAIENTQLVTLSFQQWTRMQLLRALEEATGTELAIEQTAVAGKFRIAFHVERGASLPNVRVTKGRNLLDLAIDSTDEGMATVVQPFGGVASGDTEPASLAEHVWTVGTIAGQWVPLYDSSGVFPIAFETMLTGRYLQFTSAGVFVRRLISNSRTSDSAVFLADVSGLSAGMQVSIVFDANGTPLYELTNPAARLQYGRKHRTLSVSGARGERNYLANGNFSSGATGWSATDSGYVEAYQTTEIVSLMGAVDGAQGSGVTSLPLKGLPAGATIRRGERISVGLATIGTTNAKRLIQSTGEVTVPLAAPTTFALADEALVMRPVAVGESFTEFTVDGAQSSGVSSVALLAPVGTPKLVTGHWLRFAAGLYQTATVATGYSFSETNPTPFDITVSITVPLAAAFGTSPVTVGAPITFFDLANSVTFSGTVTSVSGDGLLVSIDFLLPGFGSFYLQEGYTLEQDSRAVAHRQLSGSYGEWDDDGQLSVTWTGTIPFTVAIGDQIAVVPNDGDPESAAVATLTARATITSSVTVTALLERNGALYVQSGTVLTLGGSNVYAASTAVVSGGGTVTVALTTTLGVAAVDNAVVSIPRNVNGWGELGSGSTTILRTDTRALSPTAQIVVPAGETRTVWGHARVIAWPYTISDGGALALQTPRLEIINADTSTVIGTVTGDAWGAATLGGGGVAAPKTVTLRIQVELSATTDIYLRAAAQVGSASTSYAQFVVFGMVTIGSDGDVPFTVDSHANALWHAATRYLRNYSREVRAISVSLVDLRDIIGTPALAESLRIGVRLALTDVGETLRLMAAQRNHLNPAQTLYTVETLQRSAARQIATGSSGAGSLRNT